jgi:hypothetical protein
MRTVMGEGADAIWREDGRPLTDWEQRMRLYRCDVWMPIDDAVYRLHLAFNQCVELERLTPVGILWAGTPAGDEPADQATAPAAHGFAMLRLSLVGGGMGVRFGKRFVVSPVTAVEVTDYVASRPLTELWRIVRTVTAALQQGRPATPEEIATFSIPEAAPLIPAWALEYRA